MQRSRPRPEFGTLPNTLSVSRLVLAALFVPAGRTMRLVLIALAAASDFLDGWLARRSRTPSRWGAIIDPIGDRAFSLTAFITYLVSGAISPLELVVVLSRDIMTVIGFIVARVVTWLRRAELKARFPGKLATVCQLVVLVLIAAEVRSAIAAAVIVTGLVSVWAIADYTVALWRARAP